MDKAIKDELAKADRLALQARAAYMAGNRKLAAELLRQHDKIFSQLYDQLDSRAEVANPSNG